MRSYYGADGRLRLVDRRTCLGDFPDAPGTVCHPSRETAAQDPAAFEEYRYDALGRRVLVRTRQEWACRFNCRSALMRTIWDGDQVLYEISAPGGSTASADTMEADTGHTRSATQPDPDNTVGFFPHGRVMYVHGGALDAPLAFYRMEYSDSLPGPNRIVPQANWRGSYDSGHSDTPCVTMTYTNALRDEADPNDPETRTWTSEHCVQVHWPAEYLWSAKQYRVGYTPARSWMGSLITESRDASGLYYRRNRFYDPESGRFTQEDPIGIAGGLNVYGFANGDPVNYSDPYGLKAECGICARLILGGLARAGLIRGTVIVGAGGVRLLSAGLRGHERMGGHTISRHVNVTLPQMAQRLASSPNLQAVFRFRNLRTADGAVTGAIQSNATNVQAWLGSAGGPRLAFTHQVGQPIGEVLQRGASSPTVSHAVRVVLERSVNSPTGYKVITAYPQ